MATNCIGPEDIDHSPGCSGNVPGIVPGVIFGYHSDVEKWPDEPKPAAGASMSPEKSATLDGHLIMKTGARAFSLEFTEDAGSLTVNPTGEIDGGYVDILTLVKARLAKKIPCFMNAAINRKMFFTVQDENGLYYLPGNKRRGCSFVTGGDGATSGTASDRNQASLQFKFRAGRALVYEGDVEDILEPQVPPAV